MPASRRATRGASAASFCTEPLASARATAGRQPPYYSDLCIATRQARRHSSSHPKSPSRSSTSTAARVHAAAICSEQSMRPGACAHRGSGHRHLLAAETATARRCTATEKSR
eukprot:3964013-Prymnesium_polylepis.1